jgi:peptide/nickel transport system substrate-binding protein
VRKAVAYAVDKEGIVDSVLKGHATVATAIPSPQQLASVYPEAEAKEKLDAVKHYSFSIKKAKEELALSKAKDGFETTVYYPDSYKSVGDASLVIAESLKELGITLNVKQIPLDQWLSEVGNGEQGIAWMIYLPTTAEPGEITSWLLDAQGKGTNPANWENKEVADLTAKVAAATSLKSSIKPLIKSMDIAQKQAIYSPVYWGESPNALAKGLTLESFNSYTLLSPNWPQYFKKS